MVGLFDAYITHPYSLLFTTFPLFLPHVLYFHSHYLGGGEDESGEIADFTDFSFHAVKNECFF